MKKALLIIALIIFILGFFIWFNAPKLASVFFSYDFKVPVSIEEIQYTNGSLDIGHLQIANLKKGKTQTALYTQHIFIKSSLKNFFSKTLIVEFIRFKDTELNIEYYDKSGRKNNWADIVNVQTSKSKNSRPFLIKKLVLEDFYVTLYKRDDSKQAFPKIVRLELNNISSDSGFPSDQIEKAIFNAMLKSIFEKFGLRNLIDTINPKNLIPNTLKLLPFVGENNNGEKEEDASKSF